MRFKRLTTVGLSMALSVGLVLPASAVPEEKHGSCQGFGQAFAAWARGELIELGAGTPGTVMPVLAQTAPGAAAAVLHAEKVSVVGGVPGTPFCEPHPND
jgi:hypothetical protein